MTDASDILGSLMQQLGSGGISEIARSALGRRAVFPV